MKRALKRQNSELYYFVDGVKKFGAHDLIRGNVSGIRGNVSWISGDVSGIRGDVSGISGNVSGIRGNVSGIRGNVDDCEISDDERKNGIDISSILDES